MISIVDDIGSIVQSLRNGGTIAPYDEKATDGSGNLLGGPYFDEGHRQEIVNNLSDKSQKPIQQKRKFPLIALRTDIVRTERGNVVDFNLNILIAVNTKLEYSREEREAISFKPILYPLLDKFKNAFSESGLGFMWDSTLDQTFPPIQSIDRAFYGTPDAQGNSRKNIFNEPVDAIEIVNMKFSKQDFIN